MTAYNDLVYQIGRAPQQLTHTNTVVPRHTLYQTHAAAWRFYKATYDGGRSYLIDYLPNHKNESAESFRDRLERAYFPNHCQNIINTYASHIYRRGIKRSTRSKILEALFENMSGSDDHADTFMERALVTAQVFGLAHVITNRLEPSDFVPQTRAQEMEAGRKPYHQLFTPLDLVDWHYDSQGNPVWIVMRETYEPERKPLQPHRGHFEQYRVWTRTSWHLYRLHEEMDKEGGSSPTLRLHAEGTHPCGRVPLTTIYWGARERVHPIATSAIEDLAHANRRLASLISLIDEQIHQHVFNILCVPESTYESLKSTNWSVAGTLKVPEQGQKPYYLGPDVTQAQFIRTEIAQTVEEIRRTSGMSSSNENTRAAHSGEALGYLWNDKNALLRKIAHRMQDAEHHMCLLAQRWMEEPEDAELSIPYPEDFNVDDLGKELDQSLNAIKLGIRGQALVNIQLDSLRKLPAFKDMDEKDLQAIKDELQSFEEANVSALLAQLQATSKPN